VEHSISSFFIGAESKIFFKKIITTFSFQEIFSPRLSSGSCAGGKIGFVFSHRLSACHSAFDAESIYISSGFLPLQE
jgi:hypothetical protein